MLKKEKHYLFVLVFVFESLVAFAQQKDIDFFVQQSIKNNPQLIENTNLQKYFQVQNEFIAAQNTKPQFTATGDLMITPFFFDNGRPISITNNPSSKAYGYDVGLTNGGLYAGQINASLPIFNSAIVKSLYEQNKVQANISAYSRGQIEHDLQKNIIDQYIITYQFLQQTFYVKKIIAQLENRKPLVAELVKHGLLQQNDFLLLDIQLTSNKNDLQQLQFAYNNGIAALKTLALINDTINYVLEKPAVYLTPNPQEYYYVQKFKLDSLNLEVQQEVFNSKYKPQVSLLGSAGIYGTDLNNITHNIGMAAGIHLSVPIYDGHQRSLYQKQKNILATNQKLYLDNTKALQQINLQNAKKQIEQWKQIIAMAEEPIKRQELLLDIIKDKVIKGQVTVMDYINALQEYAVLEKNKALAETNLLLYINQYNYYNW